ncbi:MAG TPA: diacylglycerol kinase family protein [Candidatus Acidoferrum sp.]|nr:diacylglycerol kinase family protein [Candidatus Acidoferrum sp.]
MIVVAANPYRGAAGPRARVEALVAALGAAGATARVVWDAAERAALLGDHGAMADVRCVVAAGGDGTVAAVINELVGDVPLAVLPTGNENLFARALGFNVAPARLARAIAAGGRRRLDLGQARTAERTRRFGLMLSAGFDAEVVHRVARLRASGGPPRRVGRASYVRPMGAALWTYRHTPVSVTADGVSVAAAYCVIGNLPDYAMALSLTPDARADDGLLDWVAFERCGLVALTAYAWAVMRARHHALPHVRGGRARRLHLTSALPVPVQLDGEPAGFTPVEVEVLPAALVVVVV